MSNVTALKFKDGDDGPSSTDRVESILIEPFGSSFLLYISTEQTEYKEIAQSLKDINILLEKYL